MQLAIKISRQTTGNKPVILDFTFLFTFPAVRLIFPLSIFYLEPAEVARSRSTMVKLGGAVTPTVGVTNVINFAATNEESRHLNYKYPSHLTLSPFASKVY